MAKDRVNRTRKNELKIYLSDNEKYILDRKVELSKRKSAADYIRTLILFGFVYEEDMAEVKTIMDQVWKTQKAMLKKQPLIHNEQIY